MVLIGVEQVPKYCSGGFGLTCTCGEVLLVRGLIPSEICGSPAESTSVVLAVMR